MHGIYLWILMSLFLNLMDFVSRLSDCHICRCGSSTCMAAYGSWGRQSQHANCWLEVGICSFSSHNCAILPELPVQLSSQSSSYFGQRDWAVCLT